MLLFLSIIPCLLKSLFMIVALRDLGFHLFYPIFLYSIPFSGIGENISRVIPNLGWVACDNGNWKLYLYRMSQEYGQ